MDFYRPIRFLFGECVFCVPRRDFPRLANIYASSAVPFKIDKRSDNEKTVFITSLMAAEHAEELALAAGIPICLITKRGLPFLFLRYIKRFGLIAGVFVGLALVFIAQLFVWKIDIDGNTSVTDGEIKKCLSECGLSVGTFIPSISARQTANDLLLTCDPISSAAITVKGTHVTVSVLERTHTPEIVDSSGYYNVIAARDGVIIDVDAVDGTPAVKTGDTVVSGQLLINSFMEGVYGTYTPTHARGTILALVHEQFDISVPAKRTYKSFTGRSCSKTSYNVLGANINAFIHENPPYEYFDYVTSEKDLKIFGFIELPVKISSVTYYEYVPEDTVISMDMAELIAREELDGWLASLDREVTECETEVTFDEKNGSCLLKADAVVITDICKEVPFTINDYGRNISAKLPKARE